MLLFGVTLLYQRLPSPASHKPRNSKGLQWMLIPKDKEVTTSNYKVFSFLNIYTVLCVCVCVGHVFNGLWMAELVTTRFRACHNLVCVLRSWATCVEVNSLAFLPCLDLQMPRGLKYF